MRQFLSPELPDKNGLFRISGKDFRYLRQVLRLKAGDMLSVRAPDGSLFSTTVCTADDAKRTLTLQVCGDCDKNGAPPSPAGGNAERGVQAETIQTEVAGIEYWLFQFAPQPSKMELIVRQAVECGVSVIVPVTGEYSQKAGLAAVKESRRERLLRIIREARQQSGSPVDSRLTECLPLTDALSLWKEQCSADEADGAHAAFALLERGKDSSALRRLTNGAHLKKIAIAVGSEGGISPDEASALEEAGFIPVHFQGNILRCETAALYGIAAVQSTVSLAREEEK
ncbi:MAG: RsmE family RNA methyltransferase [Treponema sp.]